LGIEVIAGPLEATSCGNVITQMIATGYIPDLATGRELIRNSFNPRIYQPEAGEPWEQAYQQFIRIVD